MNEKCLFDGDFVWCTTSATLWNGLKSLHCFRFVSVQCCYGKGFSFFCKHPFGFWGILLQCNLAIQWDRQSAILASISVLERFKRTEWLRRQEIRWYYTPALVSTKASSRPHLGQVQNLIHHNSSGSGGQIHMSKGSKDCDINLNVSWLISYSNSNC